jgi:glycosyltransferase involved in cell wall biosynthesis
MHGEHGNNLPLLSVVIKAFNEEKNIADCIRSVRAATQAWPTEIILADSCSLDRTAEVAADLGVTVVRFVNCAERSCGAGGQLGYQFAHGKYLLILDGDMELVPGFLEEGIAMLEQDPRLGGVGGQLEETSCTIEFQQRANRVDASYRLGRVPCLNSGGVYRMEALRDIGYFTNRNLHSREEFELGLRLSAKGWSMARIGVTAIRHHGHTVSSWRLLGRRWRSRYFDGYGELLRSAYGKPYFSEALWTSLLFCLVMVWWIGLIVAAVIEAVLMVGLVVAPLAALLVRKRDVPVAIYTFVLWNVISAAMLRGLFRRQLDPAVPIQAEIVHP